MFTSLKKLLLAIYIHIIYAPSSLGGIMICCCWNVCCPKYGGKNSENKNDRAIQFGGGGLKSMSSVKLWGHPVLCTHF